MGGFLSGLGELLGGFNAARRIDKEGFDWREKAAQAEAARQQQQTGWQQQNEDWATKAATEASLGAPEGEDISSLIPYEQGINKARVMARARGAGLQSKSALKGQDIYNRQNEILLRNQGALDVTKERGDQAQALARVKASLDAGEQPSPRDIALIQMRGAVQKDVATTLAGMRGASGTGKPSYSPATVNEAGEAGRWGMYPDGRREWFPSSPTTTMRDTAGMAQGIRESLDVMEEAARKGVTTGPIAGRLSKIWQAAYPSGNEGEFDAAARRLVDIVYTKSGKQINQQELKILEGLIPNRSKGNIDFQIKQFEDYADTLLSKYPGIRKGATSQPIVQRSKSSGEYRHSLDGGKTWQPGRP